MTCSLICLTFLINNSVPYEFINLMCFFSYRQDNQFGFLSWIWDLFTIANIIFVKIMYKRWVSHLCFTFFFNIRAFDWTQSLSLYFQVSRRPKVMMKIVMLIWWRCHETISLFWSLPSPYCGSQSLTMIPRMATKRSSISFPKWRYGWIHYKPTHHQLYLPMEKHTLQTWGTL